MPLAMVATQEFTAQQFVFHCRVDGRLMLQEHKGSAIRGAFFHALRRAGCSQQHLQSCHPCGLKEVCPVSFLLATVDSEGKRGADVPRPFVVAPPLDGEQTTYNAGDSFDFGLTLFAHSITFLPVMLMAVQHLEQDGIGERLPQPDGTWRRGTLKVIAIRTRNPLNGVEHPLFSAGGRMVAMTADAATHSQVATIAAALQADDQPRTLSLNFRTPTRLTADGHLMRQPSLTIVAQRLIERLSSLSAEYAAQEIAFDFPAMLDEARAATVVESHMQWIELSSYSTRRERSVPMSGFIGTTRWRGHFPTLLPLLLWGQITHVGKDATKGNGLYNLSVA